MRKNSSPEPRVERHKDGTVCAKGQMLDGQLHGYWEWYRKDGTLKRSGTFDCGEQVGEWTTYDATGKPHKVTMIKPKPTKSVPTPSQRRGPG